MTAKQGGNVMTRLLAILFASIFIAACGGGGSGGNDAEPPPPPPPPTGDLVWDQGNWDELEWQ